MDSLLPIDISSTALSTQRLRLGLIASNLANLQTTQTPEGGPYRRQDLIQRAAPLPDFQKTLQRAMDGREPGESAESTLFANHLRGVEPVRVVKDPREPIQVYSPEHPDADEEGYVLMPNISVIEEMVNMITVQRAYEANVAVIKTTKGMVDQALSIGQTT